MSRRSLRRSSRICRSNLRTCPCGSMADASRSAARFLLDVALLLRKLEELPNPDTIGREVMALFGRGDVAAATEIGTISSDPLMRRMTCFSMLTGSRYPPPHR